MKKIFFSITILFSAIQFLTAQNFNLQLRSEVSYNYDCASLWGYAVNGREYALVGTDIGMSIVDVTDPDNPSLLFDIDHVGAHGLWQEIKTYGHYAYEVNETGKGVLVVDLQNLPTSYTQSNFIYDPPQGTTQTTGHAIWIDEKGRMFIFGGNYSQGYACFDLAADPLNPPFIGKFSTRYIHDGFVRGDTLWAGEISDGLCEIINVADPANPIVMASWSTPNNFTHNVWPTSNNKYCFTTDEVDNSYLTSYDVTDFSNVTELDRAQSNPGSNVIIHNVHLYNDQFATTAYYKDGVVIFDVSHPDNMIQVGSYDTDPLESGGGFAGCWGVYPYLPSGNIIASDYIDAGAPGGKLSVLTPTWVAACWLEGLVTDSATGAALNNVKAEIVSTIQTDLTDLSGNYKTGYGIPGNYNIVFSKLGYAPKQINNVALTSGVVTILNVKLAALIAYPVTGQVTDSVTN
ncbi:MAG: choice-of-anchor B family protein, partial [Chitinophagales bacterium]|nr:choice-of-anchor B family protein [Chitinophagales bacterium]